MRTNNAAGDPAPGREMAVGIGPGPHPEAFPPGVNPETYGIESVTRMLKRSVILPIYSIHDPSKPNRMIPSPANPSRLIGIEVNEELHRFQIAVRPPISPAGLQATNVVGEPFARVHIRWLPIPDDFEAAPGREPPPTELDTRRSQRFTMLDGRMTIHDQQGSGFRGFGAGRTFPLVVGGRLQLRIGAVINILEGFGALRGLPGTVTVNGYIDPPEGLYLNFIARLIDPTGRLLTGSPAAPIRALPYPDPTSTFLVLAGEIDPERPVSLNRGPLGQFTGSNLFERLRLVQLDFTAGPGKPLRTRVTEGPIVGRLSTTTFFNPFSNSPVIPLRTENGEFTLFDKRGRTVGTLYANIAEGRVFPTPVRGAPTPVLRIGGFGPFLGGTGQFANVQGMVSMNSAISLFPRTLSMLYVLRMIDPEGRFRAACRSAWS